MIRGEANARFQGRYRLAITVAATLAATIHLAGALTAPPYAPTPYRVPEPTSRGWETPAHIEPVEPPPPVRRPIVEIVSGTEETVDPEILPPNVFDFHDPPPVGEPRGPDVFVPWDEPPRLVRRVEPEYPDLARQAEATGKVVLLVTIDESGRVVKAEVVASSAIGSLQAAAVRAIHQWLFEPAMQRDQPVSCTVKVSFAFSLR